MILYDVVWYYIILITHYIYSSLVFIITNLGSPQLGAQCFFPSTVYDLLLGILLGTIQRAPAIWLSTRNGYGLLYNHGKMTITITIYGWYIYIFMVKIHNMALYGKMVKWQSVTLYRKIHKTITVVYTSLTLAILCNSMVWRVYSIFRQSQFSMGPAITATQPHTSPGALSCHPPPPAAASHGSHWNFPGCFMIHDSGQAKDTSKTKSQSRDAWYKPWATRNQSWVCLHYSLPFPGLAEEDPKITNCKI